MNGETHSEPAVPVSNAGTPSPPGANSSSEDTGPITFFCRAKPNGVDIREICECAKHIFIGWPLLRKDVPSYDSSALRTWVVNPKTCPEEEWQRLLAGQEGGHRQYSQNRNFIPRVKRGSIVVIPRPEEGAVYVGRITGEFEIVDSPTWGDEYRRLRSEQNAGWDDGEIANVAQGWPVDEYKRVDLPRIPGWLRHSMFGRSTYGTFQDHPIDGSRTAYDELDRILKDGRVRSDWTLELDEIKRRLVDTLTPYAFENMVVSLLQLEHPDEIWHQTGGSGDGGIDGIGYSEEGDVVGLMQAKLYAKSAPELPNPARFDPRIKCYTAVLVLQGPRRTTHGTEFLDLEWVSKKVCRHRHDLPQALALRVGEMRRPQKPAGVKPWNL